MQCNYSKIKICGMAFLAVLMVSGSIFCTTLPKIDARIWGWFGVLFFGLCFLKIISSSLKQGPGFIVDEREMKDLQMWGKIPWSDIVYVRIGKVKSSRFLCIEVRNPESYISRVSIWQRLFRGANKSLGFPMINISFQLLSPGLDEVWDYIKLVHPEKIK